MTPERRQPSRACALEGVHGAMESDSNQVTRSAVGTKNRTWRLYVPMYQSPVGGARSGPGSHASHSCARSGASRAAMIAMDAKTKVRRAPWGYPSAPPRAQRSVFCGKRRPPKRSAPELSPSASCARAAADRRPSHNVRGPSVGCMGLPRCVRAGRSALVPRLQKCPDWATAVGAARGASSAARRATFDRPW